MTLAQFLERHPWPREWAAAPRQEWLWVFDLAASPEALWRVMSDTSRLNRALRVSEMHFEERGGKRFGWSRNAGRRHDWIEHPWDWVAGEWLRNVRVYERGYPKVLVGVQHLEPRGDGTRLYVYFGVVPRSWLGRVVMGLGFPALGRTYARTLPALAAELDRGQSSLLVEPPPALTPEANARLDARAAELIGRGLDRAAVERLVDWVRTGDDQDLARIQVRERARAWGIDEDALLRVCLHATRAGLLALSWDVVCPHCRGVRDEVDTLGALPTKVLCEVCKIDFGTDAAESVEITFHVHPSIRVVEKLLFCSAEPARKDHVKVQRALLPGEEEVVVPRLPAGRYRLRLGGEERYGFLDVGPGAAAAAVVDAAELAWRASAAPAEHGAPAAPPVRLVNDSSEDRTFVIEAAQWADVALRPGRLLSFQDFRDLFGEEYLGADVQLAVGEQTVLFTDMVGSTALYASRGDPAAFVEVKKHFAELFAIIAAHRGAVVKTIGDAAMAAFGGPVDALRCCRAIHDAFPPSRTDTPTRLRISVNTGPCIAVRLNSNIDYFGSTVNIAAKLQALAEAWQVALAQTTYEAPGVAAYLAEQGAVLEDVVYTSKALTAPVPVKRWTVYPGG